MGFDLERNIKLQARQRKRNSVLIVYDERHLSWQQAKRASKKALQGKQLLEGLESVVQACVSSNVTTVEKWCHLSQLILPSHLHGARHGSVRVRQRMPQIATTATQQTSMATIIGCRCFGILVPIITMV